MFVWMKDCAPFPRGDNSKKMFILIFLLQKHKVNFKIIAIHGPYVIAKILNIWNVFYLKWVQHFLSKWMVSSKTAYLPFLRIFCRALIKAMMSASAFGSPVIGMLFFLDIKRKRFHRYKNDLKMCYLFVLFSCVYIKQNITVHSNVLFLFAICLYISLFWQSFCCYHLYY